MKRIFRISGSIAAAQLLCFWLSYALLIKQWSHHSLFGLFQILPSPPPTLFEDFIFGAFVILGTPFSVLLGYIKSAYFMPALILCSFLNCVLWGICLGLPIYVIGKKIRQRH